MAVDALRSHRRRSLAERLAAGIAWQALDFIVCNGVGESLRGAPLLERHLLLALERLRLRKVRWHDLRRPVVSLAVAHGVPVNMISQMIEHSCIFVTHDVHSHILPGTGKTTAMAVERALRGEQAG